MLCIAAPRAAIGRPCRRALLLLSASLFCIPALAQSPASNGLETVVVTAGRMPQPASTVLADLSVVDREAIERSGAVELADLLARLPGIEFTRTGGPGGTTGLFIRGGENRHAALYIDGVRVDSQATGGALWEQIPLEQIDRIEVLRGPAAAVYGSDAIAGVVQLFTRRGSGAPRPSASASVGSHDTQQAQLALAGSSESFDYSLSGSHGRSDSFNARELATANPDEDSWRRSALQARAGFQIDPRHRLEAALLASDLRSRYDSSATEDDVAEHRLRSGNVAWQASWTQAATTRLQAGRSDSTYESSPSFYRSETTLHDYLLQHEQRFAAQVLTAALERREDELLNPATEFSTTLRGERHQNAAGLGWRGEFGAHALQAHLRYDDDSEFGGEGTGSAAWGWGFADGWRMTASIASSFRAPTLYQRFSQYGNAVLVPESGRNAEMALRWSNGNAEATLTAWRNDVSDLISFGPPGPCLDSFGCYVNVGRARLKGVTLAGSAALGGVTLRGSLDWHDPRNLDIDRILPRRARRLANLGAETAWRGWTFGAEVQASGERFENAANTQRLGSYALFNLFVGRTLAPGLRLEGRIDNLADEDYELARTYATAGRTVQLAMRWTMP